MLSQRCYVSKLLSWENFLGHITCSFQSWWARGILGSLKSFYKTIMVSLVIFTIIQETYFFFSWASHEVLVQPPVLLSKFSRVKELFFEAEAWRLQGRRALQANWVGKGLFCETHTKWKQIYRAHTPKSVKRETRGYLPRVFVAASAIFWNASK